MATALRLCMTAGLSDSTQRADLRAIRRLAESRLARSRGGRGEESEWRAPPHRGSIARPPELSAISAAPRETLRPDFPHKAQEYLERFGDRMPPPHARVLRSIAGCRTGAFGTVSGPSRVESPPKARDARPAAARLVWLGIEPASSPVAFDTS
ncbi:MAG: hypothetical protein ACYC61_32125 [Isosphaeraceae bacterium]